MAAVEQYGETLENDDESLRADFLVVMAALVALCLCLCLSLSLFCLVYW